MPELRLLLWPVLPDYRVSLPFGAVGQGTAYTPEHPHQGVDLARPGCLGDPIYAAADGTVAPETGLGYSEWGNYVRLGHGGGWETGYAHCDALLPWLVRGAAVLAGQVIAQVGRSGGALGPHLHFELWREGVRLDPAPYLTGPR